MGTYGWHWLQSLFANKTLQQDTNQDRQRVVVSVLAWGFESVRSTMSHSAFEHTISFFFVFPSHFKFQFLFDLEGFKTKWYCLLKLPFSNNQALFPLLINSAQRISKTTQRAIPSEHSQARKGGLRNTSKSLAIAILFW